MALSLLHRAYGCRVQETGHKTVGHTCVTDRDKVAAREVKVGHDSEVWFCGKRVHARFGFTGSAVTRGGLWSHAVCGYRQRGSQARWRQLGHRGGLDARQRGRKLGGDLFAGSVVERTGCVLFTGRRDPQARWACRLRYTAWLVAAGVVEGDGRRCMGLPDTGGVQYCTAATRGAVIA